MIATGTKNIRPISYGKRVLNNELVRHKKDLSSDFVIGFLVRPVTFPHNAQIWAILTIERDHVTKRNRSCVGNSSFIYQKYQTANFFRNF